MADTKKEQERDELHKAIWGIADDLRGSVDGWDFKQYVLGMMFYRYISENLTNYINDVTTFIFPMTKPRVRERAWCRKRASLSCRASFLLTSAQGRRTTKI